MNRIPLFGTKVDDTMPTTLTPKGRRIADAQMHMLRVLIQSEALGIDLGIVVSAWRDEAGLNVLPSFMASSLTDLNELVTALRELADRIEGGEHAPPTTARGGAA